MPFLGYIVNKNRIQPLPEKLAAICEYKLPETAEQLRHLMEMINFYSLGLLHASELQAPLNELLQGKLTGEAPLVWDKSDIDCFEKLKKSLGQTTLLVYPTIGAPLVLMCDASDHTLGAALQQQLEGKWEPLAFFSKKLSPTEVHYSSFDCEILAVY